jgi:lipoyl(octanoyl) transferase
MTGSMGKTLAVARPGRVAYDAAARWQEGLVERRLAGDGTDALLLLEHPAVYTLGRGADPRFLGRGADGDVPVVRSNRGGQVTWHGPGQLVGYPIVDLRGHRQDVRWYVREVEQVLIDALATIGIEAGRVDGLPGVWVDGRRKKRCKIASVGIAIRRWVTWHGFALNVAPDLGGFAAITPCGIDGVQMTSVAREGGTPEMDAVTDVVLAAFAARFGYDRLTALGADDRRDEVRA